MRLIQQNTVTILAALLVFLLGSSLPAIAQTKPADTLKYPIDDRRGDKFSNPTRSSIDLKNPANIKDSVEYDPITKRYYLLEKIGNNYYRRPTYLTFDEYLRFRAKQDEDDYFKARSNVLTDLNRKMLKPKLTATDNLFNRIFGNGKIDIRPQGNVDVKAGYQGQNIKNPTLPERARKSGGFDFNLDANLSVIANIGDKLRLPIAYNTQANFDFENQLKLDYTGNSDEIIKRIEAGNVSFSTKGSLIQGAQQLFGIKTQLQFGKLSITAVLANQRSQRQSMGLQGGSASSLFEFKADDYEENRHFLLAQYFRNNYNKVLANLPAVTSQVQVLQMEVWVTNRNGSTTNARDIVGLMDLGEQNPYNTANIKPYQPLPNGLPNNDVNDLYRNIINNPNSRNSSFVTSTLSSLGLSPVQDFEKTFARKLSPTEFYFDQQVGYLSLSQPLQADEVLGVAYRYSYNGHIYQVGEFSQDVPPDTTIKNNGTQKVLFLKLLKATSQRPTLPIWDLMMKNVYVLKTRDGSYLSSVQSTDFSLNILYEQPSLGTKRYLPDGSRPGTPLLQILRLDTLNNRGDPQPDGIFDYLEGRTIFSQQARIVFPILEPFGRDLQQRAFNGSPQSLIDQYVYYPLYDTIKEIAKTYANLDRYIISGKAKGNSSSDISLGAFNVPPGSVTVSSGGTVLREGIDYSVDYGLGTVHILNQAIINSGVPVNVQFENNANFGLQQRNYMGLRLDYQVANTAKESFSIGGTLVRMGERPYFSKVSTSDGDPIRNTMYGMDFNYRSQFPRLTRWLDKLPGYHTTEMSSIQAYGEAAALKPGHPPQIGKGSSGSIYIDDFEGSTSNIDLRFPIINWALASTPQNNGLFPESALSNDLANGYNRAKLAWYNIEPNLQDPKGNNNPVKGYQDFSDPRIRAITQQEIYPTKSVDYGQAQLVTFDMAYYPTDKGPYNFDARSGSIAPNGKLQNPKTRWGGIMRSIDQTDFETSNVEYIQFWMQDPFLIKPTSTGGQFYINLGNISEDVLRDGRRQFENGLPGADGKAATDNSSVWGSVPANPIQITSAFSNDPADRPFQDVGFDGLSDLNEQAKFGGYLQNISTLFGAGSPVYQQALADPSGDNFLNYRDAAYDATQSDILARYKRINNPQGNSPIADPNATTTTAFTLYPDQEDLNRDNTLNELEEYFQYRIDLIPGQLGVGKNYITDSRTFTPNIPNGKPETWYLFRVPIENGVKIGNIPDFKSIRFIRMFMTGFEDSVVCRFASLELVRNQWRNFTFNVDTTGNYTNIPTNTSTEFNVLAVNIEENSKRAPIPYVTPPGVERQQLLSNNNVNLYQNEQSMSLQICNLASHDARGVFKTFNLDLRQYGTLSMFIHAESRGATDALPPGALQAVIRLGNDFVGNYYEIKIPLTKTNFNTTAADQIWPAANELALSMQRLIQLKVRRNNLGQSNVYYRETDADGKSYAILGNPNLGEVRGMFLGVQNVTSSPICTEVWFNELRLSDLNEQGGWAALGRVDMKLADLGTLSLSGSYRGIGFGNIDQRVNERAKDDLTQFDVATNLELGKFFPQKAGISIPVYASYSQTLSTPEFDPYDLDIKLKDKLNAAGSKKDSIREDAVDLMTIRTINFTNVRKNNTTGKKIKLWSIENFDLNYSYTRQEHHNPLIESDELITHRGSLGYTYANNPHYIEPFKNAIKSHSPWYKFIKEFNFSPLPSALSFRGDAKRQFGAFRPRNVGGPKGILPETYNKYFTFDRYYTLRWDFTKTLNLDFTATNLARVDEAPGRLSSYEKQQMWNNFFRGGRNTSYQQQATFSYELPTNKIPILDWTHVRAGYIARYAWLAASLDSVAKSLGNFVSNGQDINANVELDFTKLYSKSRFLRALDWNTPGPPPQQPPLAGNNKKPDSTNIKKKKEPKDPNALPEIPMAVKVIGRIITSVKRMSISYTSTGTTNLAGYTDSTKILGMNWKTQAPGFDFVMGRQPDTNYINRFAEKGFFTHNPLLNNLNRQDYNQSFKLNAQLMPARDLTIDVDMNKTFGKTYSELYKDTTGTAGFSRLSPYSAGSFSVSYIAFQTLFTKESPNEVSSTFLKFQDYRQVLSKRLADQNPYSKDASGNPIQNADGYYKGYTKYAQDVLIPAFIAAYTNKDPNTVALVDGNATKISSNPFSGIKALPNWHITYTGLTRIPGMEKIFTNFTITHDYHSSISMNSFNSALLYQDPLKVSYPGFIDTLTGNFIPYFLVPNLSIREDFAPLIDLDMQFTNQLGLRFGYKQSRQLSLSLVDFQLSELRSKEIVVGGRWKKRGFALPFKVPFTKKDTKTLDNDLTFTLDFSIRDDITSNSRLDQVTVLPTSGQKVITISPSIDYVLNNRIKIILYFDQRRTEPKISTSAPITNTSGGVRINISLAP